MFPFDIEYTVTVSDLRKATYYGTVRNYRKPFLAATAVVLVAIVYAVLSALLGRTPNTLVYFLAVAYAVWGLIMFARAEKSVRRAVRTPNGFLGVKYRATFTATQVTFSVPERGASSKYTLSRLACAFELYQLFMLYIDTQETFLVPKRAMTAEQQEALRELLDKKISGRFETRFRKKSK